MRETWIYKYCGLSGLKWFGFIWFGIMNLLLTSFAGVMVGMSFLYPLSIHPLVISVVVVAATFALALLERMRRDHWYGIFCIESGY